jgi:eukaryotic-like serine/threonine-protein kinase
MASKTRTLLIRGMRLVEPRPRADDGPVTEALASPSGDDKLAGLLVAEMIQRWRRGERPLPEEFLDRHPSLWERPEAAADLIYEELCLRQEFGVDVPVEQVLARFPQWRRQLEVLFDCQRVLGPGLAATEFPAAGEALGDFLLLAELGRGAHGRVFLASQLSLGDRPVVLKVTALEAAEHLSLARLQHTHIVPLYSVQDDAARGLRALCMPYFGGATLARLLELLRPLPVAHRTGQDVLDALHRAQADSPLALVARGPARHALASGEYVEAICRIGVSLADALQYAHERQLVHLDLKPSNVLIAADGQPMLLDFHLARAPLHPHEPGPAWLGGTEGYMSPEQQVALHAAQSGRQVPAPVDGRSDIYSLGLVLYEALAGTSPSVPRPRLDCLHAGVRTGLADIIEKCLAHAPPDRYSSMAALAADLRRHLNDLPLAGVRNRSVRERWQKWRRRRPHGVTLVGMMLAVVTATAALALVAVSHFGQRLAEARNALLEGQTLLADHQAEGAIRALQRGLVAALDVPWQHEVVADLQRTLQQATRAVAARALHQLADRARLLYGVDSLPPEQLRLLQAACASMWAQRDAIVAHLHATDERLIGPREDLLDLAIFLADLDSRLDSAPNERIQQRPLVVLTEAEEMFGPGPVLDAERRRHGDKRAPDVHLAPRTAWEHYAMGRALLQAGELEVAAKVLNEAVRLQPQGLWPNFYQGLCAYRRGMFADAVTAYSVCVGAAPDAAGCFYNRARAYRALGCEQKAEADYEQALRLDPFLASLPGIRK